MKAFLSSTYVDLVDHRKAVTEALQRIGQQVGRMEVFGARPSEATQVCLEEIDLSDVFVGIYAHKYGFVPANSDQSITELEFDQSRSIGKPTFCFLIDENYPWPPMLIEEEPGRSKLREFKGKVSASVIYEMFTSATDLALKVQSAISHFLIKGSQSAFFNQEGRKQLSRWGERMKTIGEWNWNYLGVAAEHYLQAIKLDPKNQDPWTNLAYVYHVIGLREKALYCLTRSNKCSMSSTEYKGHNHNRVQDAINRDEFLTGGELVRPSVPDWFKDRHRDIFNSDVLPMGNVT